MYLCLVCFWKSWATARGDMGGGLGKRGSERHKHTTHRDGICLSQEACPASLETGLVGSLLQTPPAFLGKGVMLEKYLFSHPPQRRY